MRLKEKKEIVELLHEKFLKSQIVILTDYKGMNVAAVSELRKKLKEADIEYKVVKNTLLRKASEGTDVEPIKDKFVGPSAIALSYNDPVAPAKLLMDFAKINNKLEIKSGVMGGRLLDPTAIKALSSLPSREELLSQLLSVFNAVPTSFVRVLNAVPQKFLYLLQAYKEKKENA